MHLEALKNRVFTFLNHDKSWVTLGVGEEFVRSRSVNISVPIKHRRMEVGKQIVQV